MTKTIEHIEDRIQFYKTTKVKYEKECIKHPNEKVYEDAVKTCEELIQINEQIKCKLEAWEVVKHTIYKRKIGEERYIQVMGSVYNDGQCWSSGVNPYEIVKKALEVENE